MGASPGCGRGLLFGLGCTRWSEDTEDTMDRREFTGLLPARCRPGRRQQAKRLRDRQSRRPCRWLASGVFKPGPAKVAGESYLSGMRTAGNLRLEMHETTQEAGAPPEAIGTPLHHELWPARGGDGGADDPWGGAADGGGRQRKLAAR